MKITGIETIVCHARMRNWIFVKVVTDQPGLIGWGEATLEWHTRGVVGAIEDLSHLLIGEDPTSVEHLWQMMCCLLTIHIDANITPRAASQHPNLWDAPERAIAILAYAADPLA